MCVLFIQVFELNSFHFLEADENRLQTETFPQSLLILKIADSI